MVLSNYYQGRDECSSGSESLDKHEPRDILHCHVERRHQRKVLSLEAGSFIDARCEKSQYKSLIFSLFQNG
jgi:hypothetical protein